MHEEGHPCRRMTDAGEIQTRARWAIEKKAGTVKEELHKNDEASFSKLSNEREKKEIDRDEKTTKKIQNGIFGESKQSQTLSGTERRKSEVLSAVALDLARDEEEELGRRMRRGLTSYWFVTVLSSSR